MTRDDVKDMMRQAKLRLGVHAPASQDEGRMLVDFTTKDLNGIGATKDELQECLDRMVRGSFPATAPNVMNSTFFVSLILKLRELKKPIRAEEEEKEEVEVSPEQREAWLKEWHDAYLSGGARWQHYRAGCPWIVAYKGLDIAPFIEEAQGKVIYETKVRAKEEHILLAAIRDMAPEAKVLAEAQRMAVEDWFKNGMK